MQQKNFLEDYQKEIEKIEISFDIADNIKNAKTIINTIIEEDNITENETVEMVKFIIEHFKLEKEAKQEFKDFSYNLFQVFNKTKIEQQYQNDIIERGTSKKKVDKVFPAIDYKANLGMVYGIKDYDNQGKLVTYIGTSTKKVYEIKRAKEFGIIPTHEEDIDTNLSLSTFVEFVKNGKTVKASELFTRIKKFLESFIKVSENFYDVLVTYIMMTYVYVLFQVIPYLWINGEKGTGKSTIMKLLNKLCFNSLFCSNINPANIFRQIDNDGSTIILDEFEKMYGEDKQEIIKLLNQGFNKDGIVPRCVGQSNKIKKFRSFSPKIMGGISNIDNVLFERCIKYETHKIKDIKISKFKENQDNLKVLNDIVDDLYIFGFLYAEKIKDIYEKEEISFKGNTLREDDLWNPLLCIARVIDNEEKLQVEENLTSYAKTLSKEKFIIDLENNQKLQLLYYLYLYLDEGRSINEYNGKTAVRLSYIYYFIKDEGNFKWISSSSVLGKKLTQWYGFEKKRITVSLSNKIEKVTHYLFDKATLEEIMKSEGVTLKDFE